MSKKLYFLISFVLVLGLSTLAQADAIEVNNPSFETAIDGVNTVPGHGGYDVIKDWSENYGDGVGYVGVDVMCPYADSLHCHRWPGSDYNETTEEGVVFSYLQHADDGGSNAYQVLDMNNSDANGVIVAGRKYVLTYDAMGWDGDQHAASFFYVKDVCKPDVNHTELASKTYALEYIERALEDCEGESNLDELDECPDWNYDLTVSFVAETADDCITKTLGIKITALEPGAYSFIDNIRVDWFWASAAYDPDPPDEAEYVARDTNLNWSPGLWAVNDVNGHEVYFGTDETAVEDANTATAGIYRGTGVGVVSGPDGNNRYSYDIPETLVLGKEYFWRIDEVNEGWSGGPVPPDNNRWEGDVWSFIVEGKAYNVYPDDGAEDIPALNLILRWTAGTDSGGHDVYFGSDETAVEDANTNTTGIYRGPMQLLSDVNYSVEDLAVGKDFFWRIDEVNATTVKGDVWDFTTGSFLIVDSFEWYETHSDIKDVWKDATTGTIPDNKAEVFVESDDANKFLDTGEQSMRFYYRCLKTTIGSTAEANLPLEVGTDWTVGGVKALVVNFCGDTDNGLEDHRSYTIANDRMWVSLVDGGSNEGIMRLLDMNNVTDGSWHTWNISLRDPNFNGVDMNNVAKVYIGFGGAKGGAPSKYGAGIDDAIGDTVWFDDISLYPPRCMPEMTGLDALRYLGDLTGGDEEAGFPQDCNTDYLDLVVMARDWNMRGMWATAGLPVIGPIIEYKFDEGAGTTVYNTGSLTVPNPPDFNVPDYNLVIGRYVDGNGVFGIHPNHAPLWVLGDPCRGTVLSFDGEGGMYPGRPPEKDEPMSGGDYLIGPALNTADNSMSITAWIRPNPTFGKTDLEFKDGFTGIVTTRTHPTINPSDGSEADGLNFGGGGGFIYDGMLIYTWNDNSAGTWNWNSNIYPPNLEWSFVAVVIEPSKATVYIGEPNNTLLVATNAIAHDPDLLDARFMIGGDIGQLRFFKGYMDDIRIYDYSLSAGNILGLAGIPGIVYVPLNSDADLIVGDKDPCYPEVDDQIDFEDYTQLAKHWLETHLWP